jgi:hypothetical protein
MSQKKNNGREFTVDLDDDDDDFDFGDDPFDNIAVVENSTLEELFDRDDRRREQRARRDREQRDLRRSQTQENTLTNSGEVKRKII